MDKSNSLINLTTVNKNESNSNTYTNIYKPKKTMQSTKNNKSTMSIKSPNLYNRSSPIKNKSKNIIKNIPANNSPINKNFKLTDKNLQKKYTVKKIELNKSTDIYNPIKTIKSSESINKDSDRHLKSYKSPKLSNKYSKESPEYDTINRSDMKMGNVAVDLDDIKSKLSQLTKGHKYDPTHKPVISDQVAKDIITNKLYLAESCLIKVEKEVLYNYTPSMPINTYIDNLTDIIAELKELLDLNFGVKFKELCNFIRKLYVVSKYAQKKLLEIAFSDIQFENQKFAMIDKKIENLTGIVSKVDLKSDSSKLDESAKKFLFGSNFKK